MRFLDAHPIAASKESEYATSEDFRKLFMEDVNSLYLLSFLLTANYEKAEQCFVAGLDDCVKGNSVFQEWARPWARRIIIRDAIRIVAPHIGPARPTPSVFHSASEGNLPRMPSLEAQFASVLALEDFERFVYVLTVLERYSDQNCAALLRTSVQEVKETRIRALQHMGDFVLRTTTPTNDVSNARQVGR